MIALLLTVFSTVAFAQDIVGIYFRHDKNPELVEGKAEWNNFISQVVAQTNGNYTITEPFDQAKRTALTWMRKISVQDPAHYGAVFNLLSNNTMFNLVLEDTNERIMNSSPMSATTAPELDCVMTDDPECPMPYIPNDPNALLRPHFENLQIPCAWAITRGDADITVGVVDLRFDPFNTDLQGKILNNPGCQATDIENNNEYGRSGTTAQDIEDRSRQRHGTAMMGGIAAVMDNNAHIAGTGGATTVRGYCGSSVTSDIQDAIDAGNRIISISVHDFTFTSSSIFSRDLLRNIFEDGVERGVTFTFAVNGRNARHLDQIGGLMLVGFGHSWGAYRPYEDDGSGAPDGNIEFIVPSADAFTLHGVDSSAINFGGSSIGAAMLAGVAALMMDVNACLTPTDIEEVMYSTSMEIQNWASYPTYFTEGKGRVNAYQAVLGAQNFSGPASLTVNSGETKIIQDSTAQYNDIIVRTGGELQINASTVYIDGDNFPGTRQGRITVERGAKLIVRDSKLTKSFNPDTLCPSSDIKYWQGIRVHGNIDLPQPDMYTANGDILYNVPLAPNEAGVVILTEGTIITNAKNAVATTVPGYPYQDQVDRWGGLIIAEDVMFKNNFRAIEFTRYPRRFGGITTSNKSRFERCTFISEDEEDERSLGITVWGTKGIEIMESSFIDIGRESILTVDGGFVVLDDNQFENTNQRGGHRHIAAYSTYSGATSVRIGSESNDTLRNYFSTVDRTDAFIFAEATDGEDGIKIYNNDFDWAGNPNVSFAATGIEIQGPSVFDIKGNLTYYCRLPIYLRSTNSLTGTNFISCNTFHNSNGALLFSNDTRRVQLRNNSFVGTPGINQLSANIRWLGNSDLRHGSPISPANNVFANNNVTNDISVGNDGSFFQYFYTGGQADLEPQGVIAGYELQQTDNSGTPCGDGIPPGIIANVAESNPSHKAVRLKELDSYLQLYPNDTTALIEQQELRVKLGTQIRNFIAKENANGQIDSSLVMLEAVDMPQADMRAYGLLVEYERYPEADQMISKIAGAGSRYQDFVYTQRINLDRLTSPDKFTLQDHQYKELDRIATSEIPERSYARGLMLLLEDKRYYDERETNGNGKETKLAATAGGKSETIEKEILVYPNPTSGSFTVTGELLNGMQTLEVRSLTGQVVYQQNLSALPAAQIDTNLKSGVYILVLSGEQGNLTRKITIR